MEAKGLQFLCLRRLHSYWLSVPCFVHISGGVTNGMETMAEMRRMWENINVKPWKKL